MPDAPGLSSSKDSLCRNDVNDGGKAEKQMDDADAFFVSRGGDARKFAYGRDRPDKGED